MTILITGAAKRIGAGLAKYFSQKGGNVLIHYFTSDNEAKTLATEINKNGGNAKLFCADLRKLDDIIQMFKYAKKEFGEIDVLVNNAAIYPAKRPIQDIDLTYGHNIINTNLTSQLLTAQQFAKQYEEYNVEKYDNKKGKIINFASIGGLKFWKHSLAYNISKAGVINLTKSLALELAPHIIVNCICPGIIEFSTDEKLQLHRTSIPLERYGKIQDICEAVNLFATCNNYITGQILAVDGGISIK